MPRYGRRGGDGPTAGRKATKYRVTMPNGETVIKRDFFPPIDPVGYAYEHNGVWFVAGIAERNDGRFNSDYTKCPVEKI